MANKSDDLAAINEIRDHVSVSVTSPSRNTPSRHPLQSMSSATTTKDISTCITNDDSGNTMKDLETEERSLSYADSPVRCVYKSLHASIHNVLINFTKDDIRTGLQLYNQISAISRQHTQKSVSSQSLDEVGGRAGVSESGDVQSRVAYAGELIQRCGDCNSRLITSKILKRFSIIFTLPLLTSLTPAD
jgi:hypothetical protein